MDKVFNDIYATSFLAVISFAIIVYHKYYRESAPSDKCINY